MPEQSKRGGPRPGAGRPAMTADQKRKLRSFKASDKEWKLIHQAAKESGLKVSEYIRKKTIPKKTKKNPAS